MAYTSRLYQIEQVVTRALNEADAEESNYKRFLQFAFDAYRELNRGTLKGTIVHTKVTPDALNRVDFPQDMEEFVGLGIPYGGKLYLLTERNDIIATYTEADDGSLSLDATDGEGVDLPTAQYENFRSTGGVNIFGYYKLDWREAKIITNATTRTELILVYSTSGIYTDQIQYVPTKAAEAMVAYILWKDALGRMRTNADISVVQMREAQWNKENRKLKKRNLFSVSQFRDVLNRSNSLLRR